MDAPTIEATRSLDEMGDMALTTQAPSSAGIENMPSPVLPTHREHFWSGLSPSKAILLLL